MKDKTSYYFIDRVIHSHRLRTFPEEQATLTATSITATAAASTRLSDHNGHIISDFYTHPHDHVTPRHHAIANHHGHADVWIPQRNCQ